MRQKPVVTAILAAFLSVAAMPRAFAQTSGKGGARVGVPDVGPQGVPETVEQIMAREAAAPAQVTPRLQPEHELPSRRGLPQDPKARVRADWPPSPRRASPATTQVGRYLPQTLGTSFTGAVLSETGAFPPDTMGAVGPTQFVVFLNGRLRTFNKATGVADGVINASSDTFFASVMTSPPGPTDFTSDPQVRYDRLSSRWFLAIIDVPSSSAVSGPDLPNRLLLAVSDAASAGVISGTTVWTFFGIQQNTVGGGDSGEFLDYESLGVDQNALYVGGNMFGAVSGAFTGTTAFVIRKTSVMSGGPAVVTAFRGLLTSDGPLSPRGVDNITAGATEGYFIGASAAVFGRLIVRRVSDPGGTPALSGDLSVPVNTTSNPIPVDHLGNSNGNNGRLDALDDRLFAAHIRNGRLWTAHNIAVTAAGVASNADAQRRDAVRWYELSVPVGAGTPTVVQSGTIFDTAATLAAARQFWIPSVMVSGQGHAALGFSTAGAPFRADAATVGRLSGDTLGTTQGAPVAYTSSSFAYNPPFDPGGAGGRRWGDYSFTTLDPNDDMTMWTIQEFTNAANSYGVRAVKLIAPPPASLAGCAAQQVTASSTQNVTLTGTSSSGSGFFDPGAGFLNRLQASVTGGVTVNSVTFNSPTSVTLNVTASASAGSKDVTITNPDAQSVLGTGCITVVAPSADLGITKTDGTTTASPGSPITYTIVVSNAGPSANPAAQVTDTVPAAITGATWTCVGAGGATCGGAGAGNISDTVNLPSGSSVTYTLSGVISAAATGTLSNTASVAGGAVTDPNAGNNSATDSDTLVSCPAEIVVVPDGRSVRLTVGPASTLWLAASLRIESTYSLELKDPTGASTPPGTLTVFSGDAGCSGAPFTTNDTSNTDPAASGAVRVSFRATGIQTYY
ncbi:MAG: DUF11 domain-containing protein, partial [bacterium]